MKPGCTQLPLQSIPWICTCTNIDNSTFEEEDDDDDNYDDDYDDDDFDDDDDDDDDDNDQLTGWSLISLTTRFTINGASEWSYVDIATKIIT